MDGILGELMQVKKEDMMGWLVVQSKASYPDTEEAGDGLDSLVGMLSPLFEERCYTRGGMLAREGDPADTLFYIEEGEAEICFSIKQRADEDLVDSEASACN